MSGPLSHLTVLDLSRVLAGPWCTQLLADLGATVIKIEKPGGGDDTRAWGPPFLKDASGRDTSEAAYYLSCNRGKLSVAVDFTTPDGQRIVRDLVRQADVLVENYKVGGLEKYGLDYPAVAASNPRLVYASITGFGQNGPYADRAGYDFIIQGMSGFMSVTGERDDLPGGGPQKAGIAITDLMTGMYTTVAIQAALAHRDRTGQGQWIDTCLFDSAVAMMAVMNLNYLVTGKPPARAGNAHQNIVPVPGVRLRRRPPDPRDRQRRPVRQILRSGGPARVGSRRALREERRPRAQSRAPRAARRRGHADAHAARVARRCSNRSASPAVRSTGSIRCSRIRSSPRAACAWISRIRSRARCPRSARRSGSRPRCRTTSVPPPLLGEHTAEVLRRRLELSDGEIAALAARGVIEVRA